MEITENELNYIVSASKRFRDEAGIPQISDPLTYYGTILERPDVFTIVKEGKGFIVGLISSAFLEPDNRRDRTPSPPGSANLKGPAAPVTRPIGPTTHTWWE